MKAAKNRVEYRVDLASPFESFSALGWGNSTGHRAYMLRRFTFPVTRFMATAAQVKKIKSGRGVVQITRDQIDYYNHLSQGR